jgi:hypothetical protein
VNTRFEIDLLHPGLVAQTWQEWFVGPRGWRRLALLAVGGVAILLVVLVAGILPTYWRLSGDLNAVPGLRRDLAARDSDLGLLRSNLRALSQEALRQVRWADLLTTFSEQMPPTLRLQLVEAARAGPPPGPGQPPGAAARFEGTLRIEAITPLRPGSLPLLDIAQFMAGLMRAPGVNKRLQLKSWEVKPAAAATPSGEQYLSISIVLAERPQ